MLYLINGKYYMLRNREYVQVELTLSNGELSIKPNRKQVIETNDKIKPKGVLIEKIIEDLKKPSNSESKKYNM